MIEGQVYKNMSTGGIYECLKNYEDHSVMRRLVSGYEGNDPEKVVAWLGQDALWSWMSDEQIEYEVDRLYGVVVQWEDMARAVRESAEELRSKKHG